MPRTHTARETTKPSALWRDTARPRLLAKSSRLSHQRQTGLTKSISRASQDLTPRSKLRFRLPTLVRNGVDHPRHAELVDQATEARRPERFSERHVDLTARG